MLTLEVRGEEAQEAVGAAMAAVTPSACIIYMEGELGAGKSTLARGFLRGLGYKGVVRSPTYALMEPYELPGHHCYHLDLYRMADPGELEYLGVRDLLQGDAILLVEWPEKSGGELPAADLIVRIHHLKRARRLDLEPVSMRGRELLAQLQPALQAGEEVSIQDEAPSCEAADKKSANS